MAKSKYFELIFVFLVIFFQQFAIAQTPDKPVTTNTAISAKQNSTSKSEVAAEAEPLATTLSQQDERALAFLNRADYREIDRIKWPDNPDLAGPSKVKYQDLENIKSVSEKIKITLQNCNKLVAQYEIEIQASYGIKKGAITVNEVICERLGVSLRKIKLLNHPVFNVAGTFVMNNLDTAFFRYINSPEYERTKVYQKSIMGLLGLPIKYAVAVLQVLVLLSLGLNGFLIFKVRS